MSRPGSAQTASGPNKQIRAVGNATLAPDTGAIWTRRIWDKYIDGPTPGTRGTGIPQTASAC
jgi:hypothetical protein